MSISFNKLKSLAGSIGGGGYSASAYYYNSVALTYTARSVAVAADLFTDTAVAGDYMTWKVGYASAKFGGFQFTVGTAIVATASTVVWEYRKSDGTWAAFAGVVDNTNGFTTVGTNSVTWTMPTDWGTNATAVNTITGAMWMRARLSVATTLTEGGRLTAATSIYDYAVSVDATHEYDFGTATSGTTSTITDTTKAWATDALRSRIVYIHTGANSGTYALVKSNTATTLTFLDSFHLTTAIDNTSQYTILANFEDLYQADVAGGWGVITKAGEHSYAFACWLIFENASFGDVNCNIEFVRSFFFYTTAVATNRNPLIFGLRLLPMYGADKTIMGNNFLCNRDCPMDNRNLGFTNQTEYAFSSGNRYTLRPDINSTGTDGFLRAWFSNSHKYSIADYFEGWRSVVFPKTTNPRIEVRDITVANGYSGIEQAFANFTGVRSIYNTGLGIYLTTATTITMPDAEVTFLTPINARFGNTVGYYNATGTQFLINYRGVRFRPFVDDFGSTPNTFSTFVQNTINAKITDEQGNLLSDAKVQISDSLAQNRQTFLDFDGGDSITAPNDATANQIYGSTSFSVEAWIKQDGVGGSSFGRILDKVVGTAGYLFGSLSNAISFRVYTNGTQYVSNAISQTGYAWHHVVGVWNGTSVKLYYDNTTGTATATVGVPGDDSSRELYIGQRFAADSGWDGQIRRVRIFRNKALSAADVTALYNSGEYVQNETCPVSGCTSEYNFTEGTGTTLTDSVGGVTATLGTLTALPTWADTNTGATSNAITAYTGTRGNYLLEQAMGNNIYYSLTSQPASATRLRFEVTNYRDVTSASSSSYIQISGTDKDGAPIQDSVVLENIGNGVYYTQKEFLTVNTSGMYVFGFYATVTIDSLGILPTQTVNVERWRTLDDVNLISTDYNPIIMKVSRPGFEPVTIKRDIYTPLNLEIPLKKSVLDLT